MRVVAALGLAVSVAGCTSAPEAHASGFVVRPAPAEPEPAPAAEELVGVWNVVWDRSATGWSPARFHGTLVIGADHTVGLDWAESYGPDPVVELFQIDGYNFHIELAYPTAPHNVVEGTVDGDRMTGQMKSTDGAGRTVPWSPLTGRRVPTLIASP